MDTNQLAKTFDQSILRPESISEDEIRKAVVDATKFGYRAIVVHPCNTKLVKDLLANTQVLTVSVCDFPHGKGLIKSRVKDVKEILKLGADEIDIVANYQYIKEGNVRDFKKDLKAVTKAMEGKTLKVILEIDLLNDKILRSATQVIAKIANEENAKLVIKTKTGFTEYKYQNLDAIRIIRTTLETLNMYGEDKIRIKASGGIKTKQDAITLLQAGAHILGVSKGSEVLQQP